MSTGKAKREANLLIGKYKKEPDLSFNNKSEQPHNTRAIIAESLGMSTGKAKLGGDHKSEKYKSSLSKNDKVDPPHNTREIIASNDQA